MSRAGRRPGQPETRDAILVAARRLFAETGYDRTTIRGVAEAAGVDSRLVTHYFGSKQRLFLAVVEPPYDPTTVLPALLAEQGDPARHLARFIARLIDDPAYSTTAVSLMRAAAGDPAAGEAATAFLTAQFLEPLADFISGETARERAALIGSTIAGLVFARHIVTLPAVARLSAEDLEAYLTPVFQRYLSEPI